MMFLKDRFLQVTVLTVVICSVCVGGLKTTKKNTSKLRNLANFIPGRIPPGKFEYSDLNGLYQPKNAAKICEADPACGGFTFKGTPASSGPLSKMKYLTNFFHFFPAEHFGKKRKPKKQFFHWTSYRVGSRNFVKLPNSYQKIETSTYEAVCLAKKFLPLTNAVMVEELLEKNKLAAVQIIRDDKGSHIVAHKLFDFGNVFQNTDQENSGNYFEDQSEIYVNLKSENVLQSIPKINRCCVPPEEKFEIQTFDEIEKISCNIEKSDFFENFVATRKPVILNGCQENWRAKNWTVEGILERFPKHWETVYQSSMLDPIQKEILTGTQVLEMIKSGNILKIALQIIKSRRAEATEEEIDQYKVYCNHLGLELGRNFNIIREEIYQYKFGLLDDYDHPTPIPQDLLIQHFIEANQGYIVLGTKDSGTEMHVDPASTDAYNTIVVGQKAWAYLPKDMYEFNEAWSCNQACSHGMNELNSAAFWIHNMLPQIRNRKFYGQTAKLILQSAGDTLFMPHQIYHLVHNLDTNLALTENLLFEAAMEEFAVEHDQRMVNKFFQNLERQDLIHRIKAIIEQVKKQ